MGLTRARAYQIFDIDYKQAVRVVTLTDITLSGGAPSTVDGVNLAQNDRVLVAGNSPASENGIYTVQILGTGSNGTWIRSVDGNETGEIQAGMIVMVTEGNVYDDTQWKLTTDDPIIVGTTPLVFEQSSAYAFGTVSVSGQSDIVADSVGDTLNIAAGNNIALTTTPGTDTLTIAVTGLSLNSISNGTSNVNVVSSGGNVTVGVSGVSNVIVVGPDATTFAGNLLPASNITYSLGSTSSRWKDLWLSNSTLYLGDVALSGNATALTYGGNVVVTSTNTSTLSLSGNITGGNIAGSTLTGNLVGTTASVSETITGGNILTGGLVSATGTITGANISGTNLLTSGVVSATATITGGNLQTGGEVSSTGNITGGNVSAKLFTGNVLATTVSSSGSITGGNLFTGGEISATGRIQGANITGANLLTSGIVSATGNGTFGNVNSTTFLGNLVGTTASLTGNVTGVNLLTGGLVSATGTITGANITGSNLLTSGLVSATGTVTGSKLASTSSIGDEGGEMTLAIAQTNTTLSTSVTVDIYQNKLRFFETGGTNRGAFIDLGGAAAGVGTNILSGSVPTALTNGTTNLTTNNNGNANVTIAGTSNVVVWASTGEYVTGLISATGNITGATHFGTTFSGNLVGTSASVAGTLTGASTVGGVITGSSASLSANVTGGNILTGGLISATGNITGATHVGTTFSGNLTGTSASLSGTVTAASTVGGVITGSSASLSANVTGGNLLTSGLISATGNVTGNNISATNWVTGANLSATGNVLVAGYISVVGNLYVANVVSTSNLVVDDPLVYFNASASYPYNYQIGFYSDFTGGAGNTYQHTGLIRDYTDGIWKLASNLPEPAGSAVSFTNAIYDPIKTGAITSTSTISATGNITGGNLSGTNIVGTLTTASQTNITAVGTLTSLNSGSISSSGNITGANVLTSGLISATGNITGATHVGTTFSGNLTGTSASLSGTVTAASTVGGVITGTSASLSGTVTAASTVGGVITGSSASVTGALTGTSTVGGVITGTSVSVTGTATSASTVGGVITGSNVSVTGALTGASTVGGVITGTSASVSGGVTAASVAGGVITGSSASLSGTVTAASTVGGVITGTSASLSANVTGGNILTGGLISATGNITGATHVGTTFSGNLTGTSASLSGTVTAASTVGGVITGTSVSASGTVTGSQFNGSGAGLTSIPGANVSGTVASATSATSATTATNLSGGTVSATSILSTQGVSDVSGTGSALRIVNPGGGSYATSTSVVTGAIKIKLPVAANNSSTMLRFRVTIYEYSEAGTGRGTSRTFEVGGYNYVSGSWYNCFATQLTEGGGDLNVRWGTDGTSDCVWIGETSTAWSYPQIFVTDFQGGYSNYTQAAWASGWAVSIEGTLGTVEIGPVVAGRVFHGQTSNLPAVDNTYNLGSASLRFATVYGVTFSGVSTTAKYADLAENYRADNQYTPGTVVVFGGNAEVTQSTTSHDTAVAGVVSTNPAYLMNSELTGLSVAVAMTGRVPCYVVGPITKGDVLVTSDIPGAAQRIDNSKFIPGCVIGKALEDFNGNLGMIEAVVGRF